MHNETKSYIGRSAPPQYVVARREKRGPELLRVSLGNEKNALPVFSFEELAQGFLRTSDLGPEWHIRELYNGELASLLLGVHKDVEWILPNPLPEPFAAAEALLNLVDRGSFVRFLLTPRNLQIS